jgi:hypothetical protein
MADEDAPPARRARYGLLLLTLIATYLVSAFTQTRWGGVIHVAFVTLIALVALRHSQPLPRWAWPLVGAGLAITVAAAVSAGSTNHIAQGLADSWNALMLLATVVLIVDRVVRMDEVTIQSIYGALSAYLLIGLMFAAWFGAIGSLAPGPFFAQNQPDNTATLQYFSFTTLTTLGYGDFTAAGNVGRAVAVIEALTGQVFLATLVARLVSAARAGDRRARRRRDDSSQ